MLGSKMNPNETPVDFGNTAQDYARFRIGFPEELFQRLHGYGVGLPGQRILDLATGTGTLARGFAKRGCEVTAIDRSPALLAEAARLDSKAGLSVRWVEAPAEATGLPEAFFHVVTAGQSWHWFDRLRAAAEARRVLMPGGTLVIAHLDFIPLSGTVAETTERLMSVYNPSLVVGDGSGLYPAWLRDAATAGFLEIETFSFDRSVPYTHEAWRGRIRASAAVGASLGPDEVQAFDRDLRRLLEERFRDPMEVFHRVWTVVARCP